VSIGPLGGIVGSAAGSPLAQTSGSEVERAGQEAGAEHRRVQSDRKADAAAGIGQADGEDHEPAERDADGRSPWKFSQGKKPSDADEESNASTEQKHVKDAAGQSGSLLDLTA
jgi:hypothetical protein